MVVVVWIVHLDVLLLGQRVGREDGNDVLAIGVWLERLYGCLEGYRAGERCAWYEN